jgi:hypothetical protein
MPGCTDTEAEGGRRAWSTMAAQYDSAKMQQHYIFGCNNISILLHFKVNAYFCPRGNSQVYVLPHNWLYSRLKISLKLAPTSANFLVRTPLLFWRVGLSAPCFATPIFVTSLCKVLPSSLGAMLDRSWSTAHKSWAHARRSPPIAANRSGMDPRSTFRCLPGGGERRRSSGRRTQF